jgi:hypothetical protein
MVFQSGIHLAALAILVSTFALVSARATADDLFVYRSEDGRFSVDLPAGPPTIRELTGSKFSITGNNVRHTVFDEGAEYAVEIHDIPRVAELMLTSHFVLQRSVKGMLDDIGAREVDSAEVSLQGKPAREVAFEIPDSQVKGRLLLVLAGRRLYLVSVRHPRSIDPPEVVAPFFESFSFWPE